MRSVALLFLVTIFEQATTTFAVASTWSSSTDGKCMPTQSNSPTIVLDPASVPEGANCAVVRVKHEEGPTCWNYDMPPTPYEKRLRLCDVEPGLSALPAHFADSPGFYEVVVRFEDSDGNIILTDDVHRYLFRVTPHGLVSKTKVEIGELGDCMGRKRREKEVESNELHAKYKSNADEYTPKWPELLTFSEEYLHPDFLDAYNTGDLHSVLTKQSEFTDLYSIKVFTKEFCEKLLDELEHTRASGVDFTRPNSMNNYGVVLSELNMDQFLEEFMEYLKPWTSMLFWEWGGANLDSQHSFSIRYTMTEDRDLDFHMDQSDVTLNLCLGKKWTGGNVYYRGVRNSPNKSEELENVEFAHEVGSAMFHVGQHWHGATTLTSGERHNVVMWFRNSRSLMSAAELYADEGCFDNSKRAIWKNEL